MPASESQVVVRNGFLEVVSGAEHKRPRAQTDCPVGSELRVFLTDSLAHIATPSKFVPTFYDSASLVPMYQGQPWAAPVYGMPRGPMESQMHAPAQEQYTQPSVPKYYTGSPPSPPAPVPAQRHWCAAPMPNGTPTTMMLRGLPVEFDRAMLLELFDSEGFAGLYDFVYLSADFRNSRCFGNCFVNFVTPAAAEGFQQHFHGFNRWAVACDRIADVMVSDPLQGLEAHIERYRDSPLMHESVPDMYKPVLLANGVRIAFPPPTKRLKAPRMRPAKDANAV